MKKVKIFLEAAYRNGLILLHVKGKLDVINKYVHSAQSKLTLLVLD